MAFKKNFCEKKLKKFTQKEVICKNVTQMVVRHPGPGAVAWQR
jgi:hypothetical protein